MKRLIPLLALLLSACASQPAREPVKDVRAAWEQHRASVSTLRDWRAVGRIAVTLPNDGGRLDLDWRESPDDSEITLVAPFGQGAVRLAENGDGVVLNRPDAPPLRGRNPDLVLARATGWEVPVARLRRWMVGLPDIDESYELDQWGRLSSVRHDGWQVRYLAYRQVEQRELPQRIALDKGDLKVRVAIESWNAEVAQNKSQRIEIPGAPQ